jgi:hypothetical protein
VFGQKSKSGESIPFTFFDQSLLTFAMNIVDKVLKSQLLEPQTISYLLFIVFSLVFVNCNSNGFQKLRFLLSKTVKMSASIMEADFSLNQLPTDSSLNFDDRAI